MASQGYELLLVEYVPRGKVLRFFIDRPEGVTVEDCSQVSHWVGDLLDAEGLLEGVDGADAGYTLEVSSPGLDRPLVKRAHFEKYVGRQVQFATKAALDEGGRRKGKGVLVAVSETGVCVDVDGRPYEIAFQNMDRVRLVPIF